MKRESADSGGTYHGIGLERCSTSSAVLYRSDRTDTRPAVANLYFQTLQESWCNQYELPIIFFNKENKFIPWRWQAFILKADTS